jgi:mannose-6-phosphate isomerase-like protein (cupin superfamily)
VPIVKRSLSKAPVKRVDRYLDIAELFEEPTAGLGVAVATLKGPHGKIINDLSDKVYLVLEGKGRVFVGNESVDVLPMDLVYIPPNTEHGVKGDIKFLCVMSPPFDPQHDRETGSPLEEES